MTGSALQRWTLPSPLFSFKRRGFGGGGADYSAGRGDLADDEKRSEFMETWTVVLLRFASVLVLMIILLLARMGGGLWGGLVPDRARWEVGG